MRILLRVTHSDDTCKSVDIYLDHGLVGEIRATHRKVDGLVKVLMRGSDIREITLEEPDDG